MRTDVRALRGPKGEVWARCGVVVSNGNGFFIEERIPIGSDKIHFHPSSVVLHEVCLGLDLLEDVVVLKVKVLLVAAMTRTAKVDGVARVG